MIRFIVPLLCLGGWTACAAAAGAADFVRDVQPIFERSCQGCHGAAQQLGQLRLDSKESVFGGGVSGGVVKPGDAAGSELYRRVAGLGEQARMPMGGELPAEEIAVIRGWIEQGAEWPADVGGADSEIERHWAFIPPARPEPPTASVAEGWARNPLDSFVAARLEQDGLTPAKPADKITLLRRLSLDLIGLPPTIEEVDAFLADDGPDAYDKQVERLLRSPHYGEKWARWWLDAARYADSDGFEKDKPREVWFYRDWVINALNADMPYDRFVVEQIAGDLLPEATQAQRVATGFLRNSMINEEGGIDPEQFRMEAMFDRMDAVGKAVLGLTVQCAQCHNHKFDPLTQEEYYRIFAFLNNSHEAAVTVYTPEQRAERERIFAKIHAIEERLKRETPDWRERLAAWERRVRGDQPKWTVVQPEVLDISTGGQKYLPLEDGSFLAQGYAPTKHTVHMSVEVDRPDVRAVRLELLTHPNLPRGGPGRSIYGAGALTEFELYVAPKDNPEEKTKLAIARATADVNPPETELTAPFLDKSGERRVTGSIEFAVDGDSKTAWGIDVEPGRTNQPRKAVFTLAEPVPLLPGGTVLWFHISQRHGGWNSDDNQNNNLGRLRLSLTGAADAAADPLPATVREAVSRPAERRTAEQSAAIFSYWRSTVPEWAAAEAEIERLWSEHPLGSTQLVMYEREKPRPTHRLERGDFLKKKEAVEPGAPRFLHALDERSEPPRLQFARWLVDRDSPTAARTIVNRVWQAYFGVGIVATPEDLGRQSPAPSHPKLLDWLAVELMDNDWSFKALHRRIVASATYRQTSAADERLASKDPYNRLLARGPRFRVPAETVRDIVLAASGLLDRTVGGPSVYPPAPEFLFQPPVSYGPKIWETETGSDRYRRALYTFRYRSLPYPALDVFDAPNGDSAVVRRARSNTPLQALTMLNEPIALEAARALAFRTLTERTGDDDRLEYAFRRCLARKPAPAEREELKRLLAVHRERYSNGELNPWEAIAATPALRGFLPGGATASEAAAWTAVGRVLLNLDETITKE